jgi:murein DD-endopeptidase MepM/ murein hydrolase activator NlpD
MSDNKKSGRGMFGKGYYIALILCAAAIGITGYLYYRNTQTQQPQLQAEEPAGTVIATEAGSDVAVIATQPHEDTVPATTTPTEPGQKRKIQTMAPVSGEEVSSYSMEALSYNQTTRDWRVHNGIDIAAEAGTEVVAAADGEVYTVYDDDVMGTTVVIRHQGGYTTRYSSLGQEVAVKAGDTVTMGQTIGTVGTTALMETALGDHVHFSVTCDGEAVDPAEFIGA